MLAAYGIILTDLCTLHLMILFANAPCLPQSLVQVFLTLAVHNSSKQLPGLQVSSAATVGASALALSNHDCDIVRGCPVSPMVSHGGQMSGMMFTTRLATTEGLGH
jgi:hypothetical protein